MASRDSPVVAARRARLKTWIDERCHGRQIEFVATTGINQGELSALIGGAKSFGEKKAQALERMAGMPAGYLVAPLLPPASAGPVAPDRSVEAAITKAGDLVISHFEQWGIEFKVKEDFDLIVGAYSVLARDADNGVLGATKWLIQEVEGRGLLSSRRPPRPSMQ